MTASGDRDFMTHAEMAQNFPGRPSLELVVLREWDGDRMWSRTDEGWLRLEDKPRGR